MSDDKFMLADGTPIEPNYIKLSMNWLCDLIWDYYMYIDKSNYTIDHILADEKIRVKFFNGEYWKDGSDFRFCTLRCAHKYSNTLIEKVFPRLHRENIILGGSEYTNLCEEAFGVLNKYITERMEKENEICSR